MNSPPTLGLHVKGNRQADARATAARLAGDAKRLGSRQAEKTLAKYLLPNAVLTSDSTCNKVARVFAAIQVMSVADNIDTVSNQTLLSNALSMTQTQLLANERQNVFSDGHIARLRALAK